MKKYIISLFILLSFFSCDEKEKIEVQALNLNKSEIQMEQGEEFQFKVKIIPVEATDKSLTWSSSDDKIAEITESGLLKAISLGDTKILVESVNGTSASCSVKIVPKTIQVEQINLSYKELELIVFDTFSLGADVLPENATNKIITWDSSNTDIVTVSETGGLFARKHGDCIITATADNGVKAECKIKVTYVPIESATWEDDFKEIFVGDMKECNIEFTPYDASYKYVEWTNSNPKVIKLEGYMVYALSEGKTHITATLHNGVVLERDIVSVNPDKNKGFRISPKLNIVPNLTGVDRISPSVEYFDDKYKSNLKWTVEDSGIAKITEYDSGYGDYIPIIDIGSNAKDGDITKLRATADDGTYSECEVKITKNVDYEYICLVSTYACKKEFKVGETANIGFSVIPSDATNLSYTIYSNNENVATADNEGNITAISEGNARITIFENNSGIFGDVTIKITK